MKLTLGDTNVSGLFVCRDTTDDNGRFVLRAGRPAAYTLSYDMRTKVSTSQNFKLMDVAIGKKDIDLGVIPSAGKTLRVRMEMTDEVKDRIRYFYVKENHPLYGDCVYWADKDSLSGMPLQINNLRPGLYYAGACLDGWSEHRLPIAITGDADSYDVSFPIRIGHVTLSGDFPAGVNHAILTNQEQTFYDYIFPKKTGKYSIDGLFPGTYFVSPKRHNFDDCIAITVPDANECRYDFSLEEMLEKLTDDLFVYVIDADGYPVKNADLRIECDGKIFRPAWGDGYSGRFYLPGGEYVICAEKDGLKVQKKYKFYVDIHNTAGMESHETFIQFKRKNKE